MAVTQVQLSTVRRAGGLVVAGGGGRVEGGGGAGAAEGGREPCSGEILRVQRQMTFPGREDDHRGSGGHGGDQRRQPRAVACGGQPAPTAAWQGGTRTGYGGLEQGR